MLKLLFPGQETNVVRTFYPDGWKSKWHLYNPERRGLTVCNKSILDSSSQEILPLHEIDDGEMCQLCWPWGSEIVE